MIVTDKAMRFNGATARLAAAPDSKVLAKHKQSRQYLNSKCRVDTGVSMSKAKAAPGKTQIARRRSELFGRISCVVLEELVAAKERMEESVFGLQNVNGDENASACENDSLKENLEAMSSACAVSVSNTMHSGMHLGKGSKLSDNRSVAASTEKPLVQQIINAGDDPAKSPILIVDCRDSANDYDEAHVKGAIHVPARQILTDRGVSSLLYRFKSTDSNDNSKRLIVYALDDKETGKIATAFANKGWAAVCAISGGFEEVSAVAPGILVGSGRQTYSDAPATLDTRVVPGASQPKLALTSENVALHAGNNSRQLRQGQPSVAPSASVPASNAMARRSATANQGSIDPAQHRRMAAQRRAAASRQSSPNAQSRAMGASSQALARNRTRGSGVW